MKAARSYDSGWLLVAACELLLRYRVAGLSNCRGYTYINNFNTNLFPNTTLYLLFYMQDLKSIRNSKYRYIEFENTNVLFVEIIQIGKSLKI